MTAESSLRPPSHRAAPSTPPLGTYLGDDDRRQVFQVLDVGEQRVPKRRVGVGGEFVEGSLYLHLHGLRREVARLHILTDLQQLVRDLPGVDLEKAKDGIVSTGNGEQTEEVPARPKVGLRETPNSPQRKTQPKYPHCCPQLSPCRLAATAQAMGAG